MITVVLIGTVLYTNYYPLTLTHIFKSIKFLLWEYHDTINGETTQHTLTSDDKMSYVDDMRVCVCVLSLIHI